jgi:hypothetical protein
MRQKVFNLKNTPQLLKLVVALCLGASHSTVEAQVHNNGSLHVAANGVLFVNSSPMTFGATSTTTTSKATTYAATDGKIILSSTATFSTDGAAPKFVNGYAETRSTSVKTLAIGAGTIYAPVQVTPSAATGTHAAYFSSTPLTVVGSTLDTPAVTAVANAEYWIIKGASSVVSLSWRAGSGLSSYVFPDVTIVGYNTTSSKWEKIPSTIDATSVFGGTSVLSGSGSITSTSAVALANYSAFTIGMKGVDCANLVASSGSTKTWNGSSWTGGNPTIADPAVLATAYSGPSFACNSLNLAGFNVTLSDTNSLEVNGAVTGTGSASGKIIMSSDASFVQRDKTAAAPYIELTKTTRLIRRFDYVYWGTPVTENVFAQLANAQVTGNAIGAFDAMYYYNSGVLGASGGWQALNATTNGKGFITRVKEQAPFTDGATTGQINLKFTGTAKNGDLTVPVAHSGSSTSARNHNLLANPYPSAIDAGKFLTENNTLVDGVIYLWRATNSNDGAGQAYALADYIAYTKAGAAGYSAPTGGFNGFIASGQGFKVRALAAGDVKFTNCMRVTTGNTQFYRTTENTTVVDRFKVNLSNANGVANQVLVAYLPETTLAYDNMYDAELLSVSPTKMYSILDNDTKKLAINARPSFTTTDQVAVGFTKADASATQMSMQVTDTEGVFANNQTPIFLHDTQLNVYHNFANGAYTFNASAQEDNTRFKIVYQNALLGNTDFDALQTIATLNDNVLKVNSKGTIQAVKVFDMTGRLVLNVAAENQAATFAADFNQAVGVYIVKVKLTNGQIVTSKLINKN